MDLSHCELLKKLPDFSGVPNLTELNLDYCTSLEEVDDSIGSLQKLVELRASGCTKLKAFPHSISLKSLKTLILTWCSSLQTFPNITGKMETLESISIESSGIQELPSSIGNLIGLQELSMTSCLSLKELPENLEMLQNLRNLDIEDEDLPIVLKSFPKLASLVLSGNNFVKLPSCIQEFLHLKLLHLLDCKLLQEIPGFPPNLDFINATNCTSLNAESSSLLLSQETYELYDLEVIIPGKNIPKWFHHCNEGEYITFWVRKKFPMITLCYVLALNNKSIFNCEIRFFINGEELFELEIPRSFSEMVTNHVWLYDLQTNNNLLDSYLENEWNQVEIICEKVIEAQNNVSVSWSGIHVSKQEADNILFTDPDLETDSTEEMEAFYASLDGEVSCVTRINNNKPSEESEETKEALKIFEDFLTKDFVDLLEPEEYKTMKVTLDYLSGLSINDGVSVEMRSVIMEVSREFTHWSYDYSNASKKIEIAKSSIVKAEEIEEGLEANKKNFKEVMWLENELYDQLAYLEERKRELEEQIDAIKANISASELAKKRANSRKREIFEEGKMLKAQRDELRGRMPHLRDEWELAKKIQENIRVEWSKLREKY
ncbi:TMV resistance protein N-like [Senna tora]|uniref:TMV resistance protein N-like n=1 Tax=Senna tora TaxID=362788 RepID=A0A834TDS0_9FABA|nr:TMV resistance protein N-like [Senna tora]